MSRPSLLLSALVASGVLLLGACGGDDGSAASTTTSAPPPTTEATTTTIAEPAAPQGSGPEAARLFIDAWKAADEITMASVARPEAVAVAVANPINSVQTRGCQEPPPGAPSLRCVYRTDVAELVLVTEPTADGSGWVVAQARLSDHS